MTELEVKIEEFLNQKMQDSDIEICDLEYVKENGSRVLRVFIDKEGGVNLDTCSKIGYELDKILDESELLPESYILEVSSPGINRSLKKEKDFKRFLGSVVRIQTVLPIGNQKNFLGKTISFENDILTIEDVTNGVKEIDFANIRKANLDESL